MSNNKLQELSTEELLKREKTTKFVSGLFAGMLLVLFGINIFNVFNKGISAGLAVPFALLPILLLNFNSLKEIRKELAARNAQ